MIADEDKSSRGEAPPNPEPFPPFETVSSKRIYDSWWVGLRRDEYRLPGGGVREHHVVEISDAVCVVPVRSDGKIVLIGQARYAHGKTHWEVPAGRLEDGESAMDGAARELMEETGYVAGQWIELPGFYPLNGISAHWCHAFVAMGCEEKCEPNLDAGERIVVQTFEQDSVSRLLDEGRIEDGFSALALMHAERMRR